MMGQGLRLAVRVYQIALSPYFGSQCRFSPTCSEYTLQALARYGLVRGGMLGLRRILRCSPLHSGGSDPLP